MWFIDLAPAHDGEAVGAAVAEALGILGTETELLDAISGRSMLMVLDNCEHLLVTTAGLARTLLERGPGVRILATSRQPLAIAGEVVYRVPMLSTPAGDDRAAVVASDAGRLFIDRATRGGPTLPLDR